MEKIYGLHQHTHLVILHIQKTKISFCFHSTITKDSYFNASKDEIDSCITYDKQKNNVRSWGENDALARNKSYWAYKTREKESNQDDVCIDISKDKLYQVFKKDKDKWDQDDLFLLKAASDFIRLSVEKLVGSLKDVYRLHYVFVVPSEWEEDIRETLLRPILVQSNLISNNDHKDRLLFCSDIESFFYDLMKKNEFDFEKISKTIFCKLEPISENEVLMRLYLVSTVNYLFDFPDSLLYPKVEHSSSLYLTIDTFTNGIKAFKKDKLPFAIQEEIIQILINFSHSNSLSYRREGDKGYDLKEPLIPYACIWELDKHQQDFIGSICIFDICSQVCKNITNNIIDDLLPSNTMKKYNILIRSDMRSTGISVDSGLLCWSDYLLEYNRVYSSHKSIIFTENSYFTEYFCSGVMSGASQYGRDVINNANIYSEPRILSVTKQPTYSSSIFQKSKPDAIMNINISIESTILSYSLLEENGIVKKVWNQSNFLNDKSLCSLGSFFSFSEVTTLNVKSSFIEFAKDHLMGGDIPFFSGNKNNVFLQNNATKIEAMLCKNSCTEELLVSTKQQIYIKSFLLLYMIYIKYAVSNKLFDKKIGYNITVEKILLNRLFGNMEGLKDIIYASGLLQKKDNSKKLRITAQGERIMYLLRRSLTLPFSLKSYFLLAQLHENYIQLTLNQVVTESSPGEEDQEAIVISDRITHIPNVYTSLCLSMWNNIVEDNSLIQLCDIHLEYSGDDLLELFSLQNKAEFIGNLKQYISKDNLGNSLTQLTTDRIIMQLSVSCNCRVHLTVRDIIDIYFQPVLQDIASLVSASFINKELFGKFWNIQYLFQLIHFDYNVKFHDPLIKMLKETTEDVIIERGINISHYVLPKSLNQLLQPVLHQQPVSYKEFQVGTLHHVYSYNCGFNIGRIGAKEQFIYKGKTTDTKKILFNTPFPLFKKGDIINDYSRNQIFNLSSTNRHTNYSFSISYYILKIPCCFNSDGSVANEDILEGIPGPTFNDIPRELEIKQDKPIVISIFYRAYSGSLTFKARVAGKDVNINKSISL